MDLEFTAVPPSTAHTHTHTVVFLHGRGDRAENFELSVRHSTDSTGLSLLEAFPSFRWVFPQAETRHLVAWPGQRIPQWFDALDVSDLSKREDLQTPGLRESVAGIRRLLASEAALLQGKWDHIVLAGISQGAATSAHVLLNLSLPPPSPSPEDQQQEVTPRRLGAFLGFAGMMPFAGRTLAETRNVLGLLEDVPDDESLLRNTPILLEHCANDPLILVKSGRVLRDSLREFGAEQVSWKEYPDGGHWFNSPAGIDDAVDFLNQHVLGDVKV